ncbi:hypothetical protein EDD16DRAFT_1697602 [Pisolithus croceorrhizus]|nr:hypothetical protein EDD16DRAFT_1697602 [Pisolithus croceorrhizus]KAI6115419.1 hypothetical protein EV401DRAFT_2058230 [Pisolithus croceorrhizus]KAI6164095.1 hypothetical protein EDD17DRAFT_1775809 [Pisolithus thermaeus]
MCCLQYRLFCPPMCITLLFQSYILFDPNGNLDIIHTPLVTWIPDYHKQLLDTLVAIHDACITCNPCDIVVFHKVCLTRHLNGVVELFWGGWGDVCPSLLLTPNALHQWHKFYLYYCLDWVINIIGGAELGHHLTLLRPRIGTHSWPNGISTLKQCMGREHCNLEKVLPVVAAGALPDNVLYAIQGITVFFSNRISTTMMRPYMHSQKHCHQGKNGPLQHFQIPKMELAQHIAWSTCAMGASYQWSSDITERCHITHVKMPYHLSNHCDFHSRCCCFLD